MSAAREVHYVVEYAKTGRSTCYRSKKTIPEGSLRIGRNSPSPFHDGYVTKWYLLQPFFQTKYASDITSTSKFKGFGGLRLEDQEKIRKIIGEEKETDTSENKISHDKFWEVKDYLIKNGTLKDLKASLELNGLRVRSTGALERLANRLADGIVFGKATCATCPHQDQCQLKYEDGLYNCVAELQWGTCGYKGTSVVIHKWRRESDLFRNHKFLNNWHKDPIERPLKKITRAPITEYKRDPKLPLKGMKFSAKGRLAKRKHSELKDFIIRNGGTYSDTIDPDLDYVVAQYSVCADSASTFMKKVIELDLAVVTELLVDRLVLEFGFEQEPYLLFGKLPPIAYATLSNQDHVSVVEDTKNTPSQPALTSPSVSFTTKYPKGRVHKDGDISYDVLLLLLQIIDTNSDGKTFSVFRKWGRVGTTVGGWTVSTPSDFDEALDFFKEHYLDKTGNEWDDRDNYQKKPGKYLPIQVEVPEKEEAHLQSVKEQSSIPSFLDPRVASVIDLIFDVNMMTKEMKNLDIDVRKMPLGKLTQEHIKKGYSVLTEIESVLKSNDPTKNFKLLDLSNKFYTIIPTDFGMKKVEVIDNINTLQMKMQQLETLIDIEVASSLMKEPSIVGQHPTDANYSRLGAKLIPLSKYSREYKLIERYVSNGYDPKSLGYTLTVEDAFSVSRPEEPEFEENKGIRPRNLLWHGSRLCNYVGILNQGLRIAPPEAPMSGYMFGKGLYFADRVQKSAPFCHPTEDKPIGFLMLVDVAVGEPYKVKKPEYIVELPPGKHSTLVLAKTLPDPTKDEIGDDKVIIPLGPGIPSGEKDVFLEDQEYVVYKKQANIKSLVKVRFDFLK